MKENLADLTRGSVSRHLFNMAVPASIGYFFNTMYNFTDTFWAGRAGTIELAALSLSFPVYIVIISFGSGIGSGVSGILSNLFGRGERDRVGIYFIQSIVLGLGVAIAASALLFVFMEPLFSIFKAEGLYLRRTMEYSGVILAGGVFFILNFIINGLLVAAGNTRRFRNFLIAGFIINILLDPVLMFGVSLGTVTVIPVMGVSGIALATVLVQAGGSLYLLKCAVRTGLLKGITRGYFRPDKAILKEIVQQAYPSTINMIVMAAGVFVITWFISRFGEASVAAYGAAIRIEQTALVPAIGLNTALVSLAGQNNGAGYPDRIRESFSKALLAGLFLLVFIMVPAVIFAGPLLRIFTDNQEVLIPGTQYLRIQLIAFYSYIILNQAGSVLQGIKKPGMILWIGFYRQVPAPLLFFNLFAFVLGLGITGVWWGIVAVNWSAALMLLFHTVRKLK